MAGGRQIKERSEGGRQQTESLKMTGGTQKTERPGDGKRWIADGKPEDGRRRKA